MNALILSICLTFGQPSDSTVVIPKEIAVKVYKDLLELKFDRIELRKKDSVIVLYQERIGEKDEIIKEQKLDAKDYKKIIASLQQVNDLKDVQIKDLKDENKHLKTSNVLIIIGAVLVAIAAAVN